MSDQRETIAMTVTSNSSCSAGQGWIGSRTFIAVLALFIAHSSLTNIIRHDDQKNLTKVPPTFMSLERFGIFDEIYDENHYSKFGHLLLEDKFGTEIQNIKKSNRYVQNINREICRQWLSGKGKQPVTWSTFIGVIREIGLPRLADNLNSHIDPTILYAEHAETSSLQLIGQPIQKPPGLDLLESLHFFGRLNYYSAFGTLLLDDSYGKAMETITSNAHSVQDINREICRQWLSRKGKQPVTWTILIDTVHAIGLSQLGNEIFASVDPNYLDVQSHSVYTHPSILNAIKPMKKKYLHQPLFLNKFEATSDRVYLNVSMVPVQLDSKIETGVRNKGEQYHDDIIWKELNEFNSSKNLILITGHPGAGKTTFLRYLAKLWANESALDYCQILFYSTLNDDETVTSDLESLLSKSLGASKDKAITIADEIKAEQGAGACFLLDSYEWTHFYDKSDYVYNILSKEELPQSLHIITARPNELADGIEAVRFEIIGFSKNDLPHYLEMVSNNQSLIKNVKNLWNKQPQVKELCTLPLLFSMTLSIIGARDYSAEVPLETRTQIYAVFMCNTLFQYAIERPYFFIQDCLKHSNMTEHCTAFKELLKIAFSITFDGERSFLDTQKDETLKMIKGLGIVSTKLNSHKYRRVFTFSHSTYGEFLAALHLATLPLETQLHYSTLYTQAWSSAFQFFFGIQSALYASDAKDIFSVFQRVSIHYTTKMWHFSEPCTFQFNIKVFDFLQEYVKSDMLKLLDIDEQSLLQETEMVVNSSLCVYSDTYQFTFVFNNEIVHLIHYSESTNASALTIENWDYNIQQEDLKLVNDSIWGIHESPTDIFPELTSLSFSIWNSDDVSKFIYLLMASSNLQKIHLNLFPVSSDYNLLAEILDNPALACLNDLSLSGLPMNYSELAYITQEKGVIPCVTGLTLIGKTFYGDVEQHFMDNVYGFIHDVWQKVVSWFWQHPTTPQIRKYYDPCTLLPLKDILKDPNRLKWLKIKGATSFRKCVNYFNFTSFLMDLQGLQYLYITEVNIIESGLGTFLKNGLNIHTLEISRVSMTMDEIAAVLQDLSYAYSLKSLALNNINLTDHGAHVLSSTLKNLPSLNSLSLSENKITSEGLQILITSLENHLMLRSLDLSYNTKIFEKKIGLEALTHLTHIRDLNLIGCKVNFRDKSQFLRIFSHLTALESLSLCKDHDVGYWEKSSKVKFAKEMRHLTQLKHFHGWDCFFGAF